MPYLIDLPSFKDDRGTLTVLEKLLPFDIKRLYYIYDATSIRGGHRHKKTIQALICLGGSCEIYVNNGEVENKYILNNPAKCLVLDTKDWHTMDKFTRNAILLVLSSEHYDINDYIDEKYL